MKDPMAAALFFSSRAPDLKIRSTAGSKILDVAEYASEGVTTRLYAVTDLQVWHGRFLGEPKHRKATLLAMTDEDGLEAQVTVLDIDGQVIKTFVAAAE